MSSKTNRPFDPLEYQARCVKLIEEAMVKPPPAEEPDFMAQAKDDRLEALEAQEDEHNTNTLYGATDE